MKKMKPTKVWAIVMGDGMVRCVYMFRREAEEEKRDYATPRRIVALTIREPRRPTRARAGKGVRR